jgi:hypothetical protein
MIVEVFVSECQPEHALADQRPDCMLDQVRIAPIDKASGQSIDQSDRRIGLAQQQRPGVRADRSSVKGRHHPAAIYA